MCVYYRKLNAITVGDPYPFPRNDKLINGIGASKYITTLDLTKGYYQVLVAPEHKEKTAFITPYGKYEFLTMPFGLVSAPSTFQRLMDQMLHGLHEFTVAYLDDILVHSVSWEEHLVNLNQVFVRLQAAGLHVKRKKCHFATNKCVYLGHMVGGGTVSPMQCKVKAIQEFSQPKNKKQVRSFLGFCGYYQKFIPNFSTVASPLSDLTKKDKPNQVKWIHACETAFMNLK